MSVKKSFTILRLSRTLIFSSFLHGLVVTAVLYASIHGEPIFVAPEEESSISVMMINTQLTPAIAEINPVHEPVVHQSAAVIEPPKPEVIRKKTPQPILKEQKVVKPKNKPESIKPLNQAIMPVMKAENSSPVPSLDSGKASTMNAPTAMSGSGAIPRALHRTQPQYPERARVLGIEGRVEVQFDVDREGKVENVRILSAEPKNMFEREIKQAMRKWRYEARTGKNLTVTIVFNLNGQTQVQ